MSALRLLFTRGALTGATFAATAVLLLAGCSGDNRVALGDHPGNPDPTSDAATTGPTGGDGATTGPTGDDGATTGVDAGLPPGTYSVTTGAITLPPGAERVVCIDRRIRSDHATDIVKMSSDLTAGGHHLVFYKSNATEESTAPTPCTSFSGVFGGMVPLYIAQKPQTELLFPAGVAYSLPAAQMVRIELHFLNTTDEPLAVTGTVLLEEASTGTVVDHANLLFYGNLSIRIPALSTATVGPTFHAFGNKSPNIFGLTGHQHQRGTHFSIELGSPTGVMTPVYANDDWAEPPLKIFDPPMATSPGQGLRYTCTYYNPTNQTISFGEGANQEMCFLWAYYYPDMGFDLGFDN